MSNKTLSAAEKYRQITAKAKQKEPLYEVPCRSGMTFKCAKPPLQAYIISGKLPNFIQNQMEIRQASQLGPDEFKNKIETDEKLQQKMLDVLLFQRDLILNFVREPKFVETPANDNEIGFDELLATDLEDLTIWLMSGGNGAKASNFRQKR